MKKSKLIVILVLVSLVALSVFLMINKNKNNESNTNTETSTVDEANHDNTEESYSNATAETEISESSVDGESSATSAEADETIAKFGKIGEAYTLTSHRYLQGEVREDDSVSLGWEGNLELCVNSAEVFDYSESLLGDDTQKDLLVQVVSEFKSPKILRINITLTNIDAANKYGVQYQFNSSMFKLGAYSDLIPENYEDRENYTYSGGRYAYPEIISDPHGEGDDYYNFELQPGETTNFTLTYLIAEEYLKQKDIFFGISANSQFKYGIMLDELSEE